MNLIYSRGGNMTKEINNQRRKFMQYAGVTATAVATCPSLAQALNMGTSSRPSANFHADVEIELTQEAVKIPIFKGPETRIWKVFGKVLKGSPDTISEIPGSYLGPTLNFQKGQKVRIYLKNNLPAHSILHWHGLHVPSKMDGNPMYAISHGETFVYEFEVLNRAGTYWYHAHTHSVTAKQVYSGLAGLIIVSDEEEKALGLPSGKYDVPIVIQDRNFDSRNQLVYITHMMQRMMGFLGDQIMINGKPDFVLPVEKRSYRLRLLNGSNSRIYKLAWDDGSPVTVIGTDGGLIEKPESMPYVMLAPAERRELWIDFSDKPIGTELTLRSIPFEASSMHGGMMGGMGGGGMMGGRGGMGMMGGGRRGGMGKMMSGNSLPLGGEYSVLKVKIVKNAKSNDSFPKRLTPITPLRLSDSINAGKPRTITLSMRRMSALLNGRSYKMDDIRPDEVIPVNTLQLMAFDNGYSRSMGMMGMPHPMHLHGEQFQIIKREVNSRHRSAHASISEGLVDSGWKDTVLVMPGERVTFLKPFNDFKGMFMYHCHNLEHEDMGMMRDFLIK